MRLLTKIIMISIFMNLFACSDIRLYKYYNYDSLAYENVGGFNIEVSLSGEYKDHPNKRITEKTQPYSLLVSATTEDLEAKYIYVRKAVISSINGNYVHSLDFSHYKNKPRQFSKNEVDVFQAGMSVRNLMLDYFEYEFSGVIEIVDEQGNVLLKKTLSGNLKPNYWEERQSDTISKFLSG